MGNNAATISCLRLCNEQFYLKCAISFQLKIIAYLNHTSSIKPKSYPLILHYIAKISIKVLHKARNATSKMISILCLHFDESMFPVVEFLLFRNVTTNNSTIFTQDLHKTYFS